MQALTLISSLLFALLLLVQNSVGQYDGYSLAKLTNKNLALTATSKDTGCSDLDKIVVSPWTNTTTQKWVVQDHNSTGWLEGFWINKNDGFYCYGTFMMRDTRLVPLDETNHLYLIRNFREVPGCWTAHSSGFVTTEKCNFQNTNQLWTLERLNETWFM